MKNILVVTDQFMRGGMETQIISQAEYLRGRGFQFHLATEKIFHKPDKETFTSIDATLRFSHIATLAQIRIAVAKLEGIVNERKIDFIHAHPFYAPLIAAMAAKRTRKPYLITLHGPTSIAIEGIAARSAFRKAVVPEASEVICVSAEVQIYLRSICSRSGYILPNSVRTSSSQYCTKKHPGTWLLASRLDQDKINGAIAFIDFANSIGASCVIAGDGSERKTLEDYVNATHSAERITFVGWRPDVSLIMNEYFCVAGMGRVALEALALDVPVLLVGYDGIKGFVDAEIFKKAKFANFSGRGLQSLNFEELTQQTLGLLSDPAPYQGSRWIKEYAAVETVWSKYEHVVAKAEYKEFSLVNGLHDAVFGYVDSESIAWHDSKFALFLNNVIKNQSSI